MDTPFERHRERLFGLAYRMLGTRADAEDAVQDAWLRWRQADQAAIQDPEAWLVTTTTRLCIDRLRSARREREAYVGPWLPEPLAAGTVASPQDAVELANDVSLAFLAALERLAPEERAALLLKDVFDYDHAAIAQLLGKSEAACRQIVHRARERVRGERPRRAVDRATHRHLLERFLDAASRGDHDAIVELLAADARFTADSGGKVPSVKRVLFGNERIARLFRGVARLVGGRLTWRIAEINGEPGIVRELDGQVHSALCVVCDGERIVEILQVMNPDKLQALR
ncbi:putative ECF-sigma factor [Mizugakiibacter sediminis]|uniref:Putative ECF-sigma factor n=1 Tax=Mizugakiibacter sediminis TaxID=1475481 RepID=A0A0K8QM33_9GAMM|nr:RNA polymerase sigma-70 factor [Mizugakiibacter sediminis]GAP65497.1 putative ECF-sigma factor [Mizugakiibacter sediminis]